MARLTGSDRLQVERMMDLLSALRRHRDSSSHAFDQRVDTQVNARLEKVTRYLAAGKEELAARGRASWARSWSESKSMGGGLAQAMFTKVADKFYDLVVRSDVGIIDVSWGLKDQKTQVGHQADQPEEPRAEGARRGLPQGAGGRQVSPASRACCCPGRWPCRRWRGAGACGAAPPPRRAAAGARARRRCRPPDLRAARRDGEGRPALRRDGDGVPCRRRARS